MTARTCRRRDWWPRAVGLLVLGMCAGTATAFDDPAQLDSRIHEITVVAERF